MYVNEWVEIRAVLTNDISSPHLSVGVRVPCMGAVNHGHEHHGYDGNHHGYEHNGYDGHHDRHEHHWHYGNYGNHHRHHHRCDHGYDGNHHKHPTKHPAT